MQLCVCFELTCMHVWNNKFRKIMKIGIFRTLKTSKREFFAKKSHLNCLTGFEGFWLSLIELHARKDVVNEIKVLERHKPLKKCFTMFSLNAVEVFSEPCQSSVNHQKNLR